MAGMSNIISGAILLVIVIGIYVAVTYMRNKKIGGNGGCGFGSGCGCDGNCSACTMHHGNDCDDKKTGE
jgi:hypothetical protein